MGIKTLTAILGVGMGVAVGGSGCNTLDVVGAAGSYAAGDSRLDLDYDDRRIIAAGSAFSSKMGDRSHDINTARQTGSGGYNRQQNTGFLSMKIVDIYNKRNKYYIVACNKANLNLQKPMGKGWEINPSKEQLLDYFPKRYNGIKEVFDNDEQISIAWHVNAGQNKIARNKEIKIKWYEKKGKEPYSFVRELKTGKSLKGGFTTAAANGGFAFNNLSVGKKRMDLYAGNTLLDTIYFKIIDEDAPKLQPAQAPSKTDIIKGISELGRLRKEGEITETEYNRMKEELMKDY